MKNAMLPSHSDNKNKRGCVFTGCCPNPLTKSFKIDIMEKNLKEDNYPSHDELPSPPLREFFYIG